jgi:hypothetical protein
VQTASGSELNSQCGMAPNMENIVPHMGSIVALVWHKTTASIFEQAMRCNNELTSPEDLQGHIGNVL